MKAMRNPILSGRGLVKRFGDMTALGGVDIELFEGDFTVIMGSSGSGKSTLLYALSGMDTLTEGELIYRNKNISALGERQMAQLRAGAFGFVFQNTHLLSNLTLYENILIAGYMDARMSEAEVRRRADGLVNRMHLEKARDRLPSAVSGGEAQRAAVARAVITKPDMLFADEPTGALNKANTDEVLNLLTALNGEGQTVLLVTHDKEAALRGNRVLYLEDGNILSEKRFDAYAGRNRAREDELTDWLTSMRW